MVKGIRNVLAHREHLKIVYGKPSDVILFQIYVPAGWLSIQKLKLDEELLFGNSGEVVDFWKYAAFTLCELVTFHYDLGHILTTKSVILSPP